MSSNIVIARMVSSSQIVFKGHQVDDQIICDRTLLSEKSLFFKNLFGSPLESGRNEFEIKDVSFDNLARVVNFISTSQVNLDGDNLLELLSVAIYLAVPALEELCKKNFLSHADPEDYCMIFKFANWIKLPEFSSQMLNLIHKHAAEVLAERSFLACDVDEMISVIESDDLNVDDEEQCWHAVKEWYIHDATNRRADFIRLLEFVRFPLMQESVLPAVTLYCQEQEFFKQSVTPYLGDAFEMRKDPYRAFEVSHSKYRLRNTGFQHGLIIFNDSEAIQIPYGSHGGAKMWRSDTVNDMVGLFDPVTQKTKWLHQVPKNVRPKFACRSPKGDLFIATSSHNPSLPNDRVLKYCIERDSWDVVVETDVGRVQGLCILDQVLYVFHTARDWGVRTTFMTRQNISTFPAPEVMDSSEILLFQYASATHCIVQRGCIYLVGCKPHGIPDAAARQVFCFVPETCTWSRKADCPDDLSTFGNRVCAHPNGFIYAMTYHNRHDEDWLSHIWSYDPARDFWGTTPVLTRKSIVHPRGIYTWNDKLLFKNRFCWQEMTRDYKQLLPTPATLVVSCTHHTIWMYCHICRNSMSVIEIYDPETNKIVTSWVLGSRDAGKLSSGTAFRIRKSALRERTDDVRAVKIGDEPGVPVTLEEEKEELRTNPPAPEPYWF